MSSLARLRMHFRFFVVKSLQLDRSLLGLRLLPLADRLRFVAGKLARIPRLQSGRPTTFRLGPVRFRARNAIELGSFQSCVVDVHDELVVAGVLDAGSAPVVVDVGANVGQFLVAAKLFAPDSRVIAFEPDPDVCAALERNVSGYSSVRVHCAGVGRETGRLPLFRHPVSLMSTLRPSEAVETYDRANTVDVELVRLDDALADEPTIDLLKIDVEGFELDALRGARETLKRTTYLLVELSLTRDSHGDNLSVLQEVKQVMPDAQIVRFGRPLGTDADPICQDVLIKLQ